VGGRRLVLTDPRRGDYRGLQKPVTRNLWPGPRQNLSALCQPSLRCLLRRTNWDEFFRLGQCVCRPSLGRLNDVELPTTPPPYEGVISLPRSLAERLRILSLPIEWPTEATAQGSAP